MVKKPIDKKLNISEIADAFSDTWTSLEAYDKAIEDFHKSILNNISIPNKKSVFTAEELAQSLEEFKQNLIAKKQGTELLGKSKNNEGIEGIVGSLFQSAGGEDVYPSIEEKAAHLLYFMVKDHPFIDGNKRCGTFAFLWFLQNARVDIYGITAESMTNTTLMVAESNPKDKDKIIELIIFMLKTTPFIASLQKIVNNLKES